MSVFLALTVAALVAGGVPAAADSRDQAAACVTLDDRPCYADGQRPQTPAVGNGIAPQHVDRARGYARGQVKRGNCALARSSAEQLGDPALLAEIRAACPEKARPQPAPAAVELW